jgi:hypothetical protein
MSLYRETRAKRAGLLVAVAAVAVALLGGFVAGRASSGEPDIQAAIARTQDEVRPVLEALELATIHYEHAKDAGEAEAAPAADLVRVRERFDDVQRDLALLDPAATTRAASDLGRLEEAVRADATAADVREAADAFADSVRAAARLG